MGWNEALAAHLMYPLLVIRYENLIGRYLGETASRLQKVFSYVKTRNCVLFFDEFDTIGKERGDTKETGEIKRTASNHPELLDRAVWRRFQLRLELKPPDVKQIECFIELFNKRTGMNFDYSPKSLSQKLSGYSFSEVEEFCTDVVRQAVLTNKQDDARNIVFLKLEQWRSKFGANDVKD